MSVKTKHAADFTDRKVHGVTLAQGLAREAWPTTAGQASQMSHLG